MLQRSLASSWTSSSSISLSSSVSTSSVPLICCLLCFTWHLQIIPVGSALYFAKYYDEVVIPLNFPPNRSFYEIRILRTGMEPNNSSLNYHVTNATLTSKDEVGVLPSLISIEPTQSEPLHSIQLVLRRALPNKLKRPRRFNVEICPDGLEANILRQLYCLTLNIKILNTSKTEYCNLTNVCFGYSANLSYGIIRSSEPQSVARLNQPVFQETCGFQLNYVIEGINEDNALHIVDGVLKVHKPLIFKNSENITFRIVCDVLNQGTPDKVVKQGRLFVREDNRKGPTLFRSPEPIVINVSENIADSLNNKRLIAQENDSEPSPYSVRIVDDEKHFFTLTHELVLMKERFYIKAFLHLDKSKKINFLGNEYTFHIVFTDLTLDNPDVPPEARITIILAQEQEELGRPDRSKLDAASGNVIHATIFQNAALHSRVHRPFNSAITKNSGVQFYLEALPSEKVFPSPFNVTHKQGIIYVNDTEKLQSINLTHGDGVFRVKMIWTTREEYSSIILDENNVTPTRDGPLGYLFMEISITNSEPEVAFKDAACGDHSMCSAYDNEVDCTSNCGLGATKGTCQWKNITTSISSVMYATCSPNFETCPDDECDELESTFFSICRQDCVMGNAVMGFVHDTDPSLQGIPHDVTSTCSCDNSGACTCFPPSEKNTETSNYDRNRIKNQSNNSSVIVLPVNGSGVKSECGMFCVIIIAGSVVIVGFIVATVLFVCLRRQSRKLRDGHHKYLGSSASLPVVPSDYVDERSSSIASQNVINNDLTVSMSNKYSPIDSKWEFPRSRLIIEQTLGEGEFGRVMKAKAMDINNQSGPMTVAVKMLKSNSSSSEQDLLSEFNLLKDIYHINVIHLLGACSSKDGPLFIIVEYAEYGSLRSYLRKCRRLEFKSCTSDDSGVDSLASGNQADHLLSEYQVNPRDLLSFAWQTAKGMEYLSEMKLVHRDLAARNILVAAGKVVKISDFGLTRDVYEGDAYLKKSMGRVPVKWMAIESLVDHIYTTKSDVWSYGIVLWEIVTLGAAPYPGVLPERLFHLLKSGYRMEKPDNCSDELYAIMMKCWQERSQDRPHFYELTKIFDDMLQANVEYLDLRLNIVQNRAYFDDNPALTDTIGEEVEEGEGSEMGYGSLNVLPTDDSEYLTSNSRSAEYDEDAFLLTSPSYEMMAMAKSNVPLSDDEHVV